MKTDTELEKTPRKPDENIQSTLESTVVKADKKVKKQQDVSIVTDSNELQLSKFKDYTIKYPISSTGGEADIYLISDSSSDYVLKLYRFGFTPKTEILKQSKDISLSYPEHFIGVIDNGYDKKLNRWYEILEYAENGSLKEFVKGKKQSSGTAREILREIAEALVILHENNIIHRDLKPANILIRSIVPFDLIISDFGISSIMEENALLHMTKANGTPLYRCPELLQGNDGNVIVDYASDWWALGIMMLEILTGKHPFAGMDEIVIAHTLATKNITIPSDLKLEWQLLLKGLLTRDVDKRWNFEQISEWLKGNFEIPVFYNDSVTKIVLSQKPYEFQEKIVNSLKELLELSIENETTWDMFIKHMEKGFITNWLLENRQNDNIILIEDVFAESNKHIALSKLIFLQLEVFCYRGKLINPNNLLLFIDKKIKGKSNLIENFIIQELENNNLSRACKDKTIGSLLELLKMNHIERQWQILNMLVNYHKFYWGKDRENLDEQIDFIAELNDKEILLPIKICEKFFANFTPLKKEADLLINPETYKQAFIKIIRRICKINKEDFEDDNKLLFYVASKYNLKNADILIRVLLTLGYSINQCDEEGITPLMFACRDNESSKMTEVLVKHGADVNAEDNKGATVLMYSGDNENEEIGQFLTEHGAILTDERTEKFFQAFPPTAKEKKEMGKSFKKGFINYLTRCCQITSKETLLYGVIAKFQKADIYVPIKKLISFGYDVNEEYINGHTPLMMIVKFSDDAELVKLLIDYGVNIKAKTKKEGWTALTFASKYSSNPEIINILVDASLKPNDEDKAKKAPLLYAARYNNSPDIISTLIDNGAYVNAEDKNGMSVLMYASKYNPNEEIISTLLDNGADINAEDKDGMIALLYATIYSPNPNIILMLLKESIESEQELEKAELSGVTKIKLNERDKDDVTLLMIASKYNPNPQIIPFLIKNGAIIKLKDKYDTTCLMMACKYNENPDVAVALIDAGIEVEAKDKYGTTALMYAVENNADMKIIERLIRAGADINVKDNNGRTALTRYVSSKNPSINVIIDLIQHGANINCTNANGETILMSLFMENISDSSSANNEVIDDDITDVPIIEIINMLMEYNADINTRDRYGKTALMYATNFYHDVKMLTFLVENGSNINIQDNEGKTALIMAIENKSIDFIKTLLENGADINLPENDGATPFMIAIKNYRDMNIINLLLEKRANIKVKDSHGNSAMEYIRKNSNPKIKEVLSKEFNKDKGVVKWVSSLFG